MNIWQWKEKLQILLNHFDGIVIPERRAASVTGAVAKVSAGASEHLPVAKVTNISRALEELKSKGMWIVGLDERGKQTYDELDYRMHCAIVLGAEGKARTSMPASSNGAAAW